MMTVFRQISLLNFLRFAAQGMSAPFITVYMTNLGYSATEIGLLISVSAVIELVIVPALNRYADHSSRHRTLFLALSWGFSLATLGLAVLTQTWIINVLFIITRVTARGNMQLLAQLSITRFDQMGKNLFSRSRMWGSVGWAVATISSGLLIRLGGYPALFTIAGLLVIGMIFASNVLPEQTNVHADGRKSKPQPRRIGFYILGVSQFVFYLGLSGAFSFMWIYIEEQLGVPTDQIGFFAALYSLTELIPMMLMDRLIARIGVRKVVILGMMGLAAVWIGYSFITTPLMLIPAIVLRGASFSMFTIGITLMIARTSAPANVATNQAILQVTMPALAMFISSPILGWIYDNIGSDWMYRVCAALAISSVIFLVVNYHRLEHESPEAQSDRAISSA
jgi:PPP family 3-phenylpropionic acid transporter